MSDFIIQDVLPGSRLRLYCFNAPVADSTFVDRCKIKKQRSVILVMLMQINMKPQYINQKGLK